MMQTDVELNQENQNSSEMIRVYLPTSRGCLDAAIDFLLAPSANCNHNGVPTFTLQRIPSDSVRSDMAYVMIDRVVAMSLLSMRKSNGNNNCSLECEEYSIASIQWSWILDTNTDDHGSVNNLSMDTLFDQYYQPYESTLNQQLTTKEVNNNSVLFEATTNNCENDSLSNASIDTIMRARLNEAVTTSIMDVEEYRPVYTNPPFSPHRQQDYDIPNSPQPSEYSDDTTPLITWGQSTDFITPMTIIGRSSINPRRLRPPMFNAPPPPSVLPPISALFVTKLSAIVEEVEEGEKMIESAEAFTAEICEKMSVMSEVVTFSVMDTVSIWSGVQPSVFAITDMKVDNVVPIPTETITYISVNSIDSSPIKSSRLGVVKRLGHNLKSLRRLSWSPVIQSTPQTTESKRFSWIEGYTQTRRSNDSHRGPLTPISTDLPISDDSSNGSSREDTGGNSLFVETISRLWTPLQHEHSRKRKSGAMSISPGIQLDQIIEMSANEDSNQSRLSYGENNLETIEPKKRRRRLSFWKRT